MSNARQDCRRFDINESSSESFIHWNHPYHQTLVMKMFLAIPDGIGGSKAFINFEKALSIIRQTDNLTLQVPKIIYLVGWQYNGHDDKYPAFFEVNPSLKRPQDKDARTSLIWLMEEAKKFHTTVSLHINMTDAYEDSPLWKDYVANDLISKNEDGSLMVVGNYNNRKAYQVNYRNEWEKGFARKRIDKLIELLPPLKEAGTIHLDAWIARESKGESPETEKEYQKKICRYWIQKGIEPTSEWVMDYMMGLVPYYWHFNHRTQADYLAVPASVCTGSHMNPDLHNSDFGLEFLFGTSMYGENLFPGSHSGISDVAWETLFTRDFYLNFLQYYYLNRLNRQKVEGNGNNRTAYFSNSIKVSLADSTVFEGARRLRKSNDLCFPALWRDDNSLAAYSEKGASFQYAVPESWRTVKNAEVFLITKNGLQKSKIIEVRNNSLNLTLSAGQPIWIIPAGKNAQVKDAAAEQAKALGQYQQKIPGINKRPDAQWFPENGFGLFIHWGIASVQAKGDLSWCMLANKTWYDGTVKPTDYYASIKDWNPNKMNFDKMLAAAKAAGFGYAVLVTRHHDGFALWPSAYGDIGTKYSFNGRDFVKEFVEACHKYGLKVGLYYSPPDWWFNRQYQNWAYSGPSLDMNHKPATIPVAPPEHVARFQEYVRGQLTELLTNYGKIDLMWFDGGQGEMPNEEVRRLQPGIVINSRNGSGDYGHTEGKLASQKFDGWLESCIPCWPKRMWTYRDPAEYGSYDAPMVLTMLVMQRAWGGNLLANVGPKGDGAVPEEALTCWKEMAKWMTHSRESLLGIQSFPWSEQANLPITRRGNITYIHFLPKLPDELSGIPAGEKDFTLTRQVIPSLPAYTDTAVWKGVQMPVRVTLLRTGKPVTFRYENGTLTIVVPKQQRTNNVDVVKVKF